MSLSFSWGFTPKLEEKEKPLPATASTTSTAGTATPVAKHKRRFQEDDETSPRQRRSAKKELRFRVMKKELPNKRTRPTVQRIMGQQLPTQRILEVMDRSQLESLLNNLVGLHPELAHAIHRIAPRPSVTSAIEVLSRKIVAISTSLPYKVDQGSEYAYLRVKPLIEDFLSALSDYTLGFLPPVETQPSVSMDFLHQATTLLHQLPTFTSMSNNYFKNLAYEQLSHTWCMCLKEFISNSKSDLLILINHNWESTIKTHNELSGGRLANVVELFKEEMTWLEESEGEMNPSRISNLQNFSVHNSPCGVKTGLLDL